MRRNVPKKRKAQNRKPVRAEQAAAALRSADGYTNAVAYLGEASPLFSAGTFVCNEVMYRMLCLQRDHFPEKPFGFVHVPYAEEFSCPEGAFSMPLAEIVRGLEICVGKVL